MEVTDDGETKGEENGGVYIETGAKPTGGEGRERERDFTGLPILLLPNFVPRAQCARRGKGCVREPGRQSTGVLNCVKFHREGSTASCSRGEVLGVQVRGHVRSI